MLFSVLKLFISIWVENCYTFKGQSFENGLFYIFQAIGSIFVAKAIEYKGSVQSLSCVQLFVAPWTAACQASLSITNSWSLLRLMSMESVEPSNHFILCHPLLFLPSTLPQHRGLFKWVSSSHQVAKVLEFQIQHQSFQWLVRTDFL